MILNKHEHFSTVDLDLTNQTKLILYFIISHILVMRFTNFSRQNKTIQKFCTDFDRIWSKFDSIWKLKLCLKHVIKHLNKRVLQYSFCPVHRVYMDIHHHETPWQPLWCAMLPPVSESWALIGIFPGGCALACAVSHWPSSS